jgi:DNA-binding NarL/FixJ family response regulator
MPNDEDATIDVWFADDDARLRIVLPAVLNDDKDIECRHVFPSAEKLLLELGESSTPPDVILLDVKMPRMGGLRAIKHIKEMSASIKVVMFTGHSNPEYVQAAISAGADGYLLKTENPEQIAMALKDAALGSVPMDRVALMNICGTRADIPHVSQKYGLTSREEEILGLVAKGLSRLEISRRLSLSYDTVHTHCRNLHSKLDVTTDVQLVVKAFNESETPN